MSDAATNFARGAELQSSLMARVVQSNIAQQQAEQQRAMLPLRLQSMEVENETARLQLTAQGYKNQVDAAKVRDMEKMAGWMASLNTGKDEPMPSLETPEAVNAALQTRSQSLVGRVLSETTHNFVSRVSAKGLPPDLVSKALAYPKGPDGTIAPEAWQALDSAEKVAVQNAALEAQKAAKYKSDLQIEEDKSKVKLQNQGRLDAVTERAKLAGAKSVGSGANAATVAAYGIKKASYLRQVDVIKADPTLSSDAKMARIEDLQQKFESEIAAVTAGPDATPSPVTPAIDSSVRDEIEVNNNVIKTLLTTKADLVSKIASGDSGKTLGMGGGYKAKLDETQKQIDALRAQNSRLTSGSVTPAASTAATGITVKADGTVVRGGAAPIPSPLAKPSPSGPGLTTTTEATVVNGSTPRLMPAMSQPPGARSSDAANLPADANIVKDPVASAFWTVVADKLGVQPENVGFTRIQKAPRSVAKDDPRVKKYYESLPNETKQAIIDEAMKRARENPKDFMPDFFDYFLAPR